MRPKIDAITVRWLETRGWCLGIIFFERAPIFHISIGLYHALQHTHITFAVLVLIIFGKCGKKFRVGDFRVGRSGYSKPRFFA